MELATERSPSEPLDKNACRVCLNPATEVKQIGPRNHHYCATCATYPDYVLALCARLHFHDVMMQHIVSSMLVIQSNSDDLLKRMNVVISKLTS